MPTYVLEPTEIMSLQPLVQDEPLDHTLNSLAALPVKLTETAFSTYVCPEAEDDGPSLRAPEATRIPKTITTMTTTTIRARTQVFDQIGEGFCPAWPAAGVEATRTDGDVAGLAGVTSSTAGGLGDSGAAGALFAGTGPSPGLEISRPHERQNLCPSRVS
jgi:hypothetical protein